MSGHYDYSPKPLKEKKEGEREPLKYTIGEIEHAMEQFNVRGSDGLIIIPKVKNAYE